MQWLPEPEPGTKICLGFDGAVVDDWTALKAETIDGHIFTPRYGPSAEPTIWNPAEWDGHVPRDAVSAAVEEVFDRFDVARMYADPPKWETDVDRWAAEHGDLVFRWETYRTKQMHAALERFREDLAAGRMTQDGCPLTALAMGNARMVARPGDRYFLNKPSQNQKIDPVMAAVLAHEAAADARADGWGEAEVDTRVFAFS